MKRILFIAAFVALAGIAVLLAIGGGTGTGTPVALSIVSGSENRSLEPLIQDWAKAHGAEVTVTYLGSVDISHEIARGKDSAFDGVWPANSLWIQLGDDGRVVKDAQSILRSPVVLGLRLSIAQKLGWVGRDDVTVQDIAAAAEAGSFRLAMTSATQSNSGASAYLGFLYALAGNPDLLTLDTLNDPALQDAMRTLLAQVNRSSGSSGWLKDALVAHPEAYDAMFNYESTVLEANQALTAAGAEPLYIVYPANGLAMSDSPLGFIDHGDAAKSKAFHDLQTMLLTPETQARIEALGRRTGLLAAGGTGDPQVWRKDWGADYAKTFSPIPMPSAEVIRAALNLYQSELRKPSLTIWVLDTSGSMDGEPLQKLKTAMDLLLDKKVAEANLLQPSSRDVTIIIPFNSAPDQPFQIVGNADADLGRALAMVNSLQAGGGTDIYAALRVALQQIQTYADDGTLRNYLPAIVAMTDGASDQANQQAFYDDLAKRSFGRDVPIHAISFGDADMEQLKTLTNTAIGRIFDSGGDLAAAMRDAKGYN